MREITSHKTNSLNEAIKILALDGPGPGGANHVYEISGAGATVRIEFQNGPVNDNGFNGVSNEALLAIVADRLEGFQRGPFKCESNADALGLTKAALTCLQKRTKARLEQGVEGTLKPHVETPRDPAPAPDVPKQEATADSTAADTGGTQATPPNG